MVQNNFRSQKISIYSNYISLIGVPDSYYPLIDTRKCLNKFNKKGAVDNMRDSLQILRRWCQWER